MLNTIQNYAIRLTLGAFKSSPVTSLLCMAGEPPLSLRRKHLETKYIIKMSKHQDNPVYNKIIKKTFQVQPIIASHFNPLYERQQDFIKKNETTINNIIQNTELKLPPWRFNRNIIDLSLSFHNKNTTEKKKKKHL
ncbi:unnamed protein product [Macrosiphum euphorbiae]|uniref:Uncharacterized protein n=1 Tax=Macrosiphum euphorbiae TaxID=13131 RepID=A0AAV0WVD3_9HEMI|nr:unnamed protein product [Macrosiphum euphorbiae]